MRNKVLPFAYLFFVLSIALYLFTRLWHIDDFPIYFFTDEANITLIGEELFKRKFRDTNNNLFPMYFEAAPGRWTPVFPVYIQGLTSTLFGKSILVARGTSASVSLLAGLAVALILKIIFKSSFWWTGLLLVTLTPTFFLHSRTAFETVMATSFYGCFLLFYLLYRTRSPWYIILALVFAAATFYSYSNAQIVMMTISILLLFSDILYHVKQWKILLIAAVLGAILVWPFITFQKTHSQALNKHLCTINSYWCAKTSLSTKFSHFKDNYLYSLSIKYWFTPTAELERHRMKGYNNLINELLPFLVSGLIISTWRISKAEYRTIILALLTASLGGTLVEVGITRVMFFIIPATILMGLGIEALLNLLSRRFSYLIISISIFLILSYSAATMLRKALIEGPLFFRSYGLYGMQYGAKQLFQETIPKYLNRDPNAKIVISPNWANAPEKFIPFFLHPFLQPRVGFRGIDDYLNEKIALDDNTLFVLTSEEYARIKASSKFKKIEVEEVLKYPDGSPGFYFLKLGYADNIENIIAMEREWRQKPIEEEVKISGETVKLTYSRLGAGTIQNLFDGNPATLMRGLEANPFVFDFLFLKPKIIKGLYAHFGSFDFTLTVILYQDLVSPAPITYVKTYKNMPPDPDVEMIFDQGPHMVTKVRVEIKNILAGEKAEIHVRELKFL